MANPMTESSEHEDLKPIEVKVTVTDAGAATKKLALTVPAAEVQKVHDHLIGELASQVRLPGFRPGKVPRAYVEKVLKDDIRKRTLAEVVARGLSTALKNEKLNAVGEPKIEAAPEAPEPGKDYSFEVEVEVKPTLELGNYKGLPVEQEEVEVFPEEVERALTDLAQRHAETVIAPTDAPTQAGDKVTGLLRYLVDGQEALSLPAQSLYLDENVVLGLYGNAASKPLLGAKVGEKHSVELTLSEEFPQPEQRGKKATVEFQATVIERPVPPALDDELAKKVGLANLAELKERIQERMRQGLADNAKAKVRQELTDRVLAASPFEIPKRLLESFAKSREQGQAEYLAKVGMPADFLEKQHHELHQRAEEGAEKELRTYFVLDALCAKEGLEPADEEVDDEIVKRAREQKVRAAELYEQLRESGQLSALKQELRMRKAVDFLFENAEIKVVPRKRRAEADAAAAEAVAAAPTAGAETAAAAPEAAPPGEAPAPQAQTDADKESA